MVRPEASEYVYDEPTAEEAQFTVVAGAEEWSQPDVVDEALERLRALGRRAEADRIEETLRTFDPVHDGPIFLDSAASARLDEIMSSHSGPLPEPPLPL